MEEQRGAERSRVEQGGFVETVHTRTRQAPFVRTCATHPLSRKDHLVAPSTGTIIRQFLAGEGEASSSVQETL